MKGSHLPWYQADDTLHVRRISPPGTVGPVGSQLSRDEPDKSTTV